MIAGKPAEDPLLLFLEVSYICSYSVSPDRLRFRDVPARYGIDRKTAQSPSSLPLNPDEAAVFLQEWLFFAALDSICDVFDVEFYHLDFVSANQKLVSGLNFRKYMWFWAGGMEPGSSPNIARMEQQTKEATFILHTLEKTTEAWIRSCDSGGSKCQNLELVLMSLSLLANSLRPVLKSLVGGKLIHPESEVFLKTYLRYGVELLLNAGWCVGELPALFSLYGPSTLLYLSTLDKRRDKKDHTHCTSDKCVTNQLDQETYRTSHASSCRAPEQCHMMQVLVEDVYAILEAGSIPIIYLSTNSDSPTPFLQVRPFLLNHEQEATATPVAPMSQYVAISHVWSDGMGNPWHNALYACQLNRIQQAVNDLNVRSDTDCQAQGNVPFWIDTLCVPLEPSFRTLAITRMARTYLHADKVLVLDSWLTQDALCRTAPRDILFKIFHSDWNTRLWTFHEAVLARECYFQCADGAFTLDQLEFLAKGPLHLNELSDMLSEIDEAKLLGKKYTLNLVRALVNLDPETIDRSKDTLVEAELPSQNDPHKELDRMTALQSREVYSNWCQILEKWFPVLVKTERLSADPEGDFNRLVTIQTLGQEHDPVRAQATASAALIRGFGFNFVMARAEDLAQSSGRQLKGFQSTPSSLFGTTVAGVCRRTTSWREDETICLASVVGLDVAIIARIKADTNRSDESIEQVCQGRMKAFLAAVGKLPEAILFWPSRRLTTEYPWRWAPASFLDGETWMSELAEGECTDQGLLIKCPSTKVSPDQSHLIGLDTKILKIRVRATIPRQTWDASFRSWVRAGSTLVDYQYEIRIAKGSREPNATWHGFFSRYGDDLFLLKSSVPLQSRQQPVLVRLLKTENGTRYACYLANVHRVSTTTGKTEPWLLGESELSSPWCVG